jgi:hypothetical protein
VGGNVSADQVGVGFNYGSSNKGQWGTKQVGTNQGAVTRTTDQATERRETTSHTAQISQLYHQLDSYHEGTNRAIFFVQPRPHVLEVPSGFVSGPRGVEGLQEFFLIVAKPKAQPDICVSVRVDTAHLADMPIMDYDHKKDSLELSVSAAPPAQNDPQAVQVANEYLPISYVFGSGTRNYACYVKTNQQVQNYTSPWSGYKVDVTDNGGYSITAQSASSGDFSVTVAPDGSFLTAQVSATSHQCFDSGGDVCINCPSTMDTYSGNSSLSLVINLVSTDAIVQVGTQQVLLVTTRGLCCCPPPIPSATTMAPSGVISVIGVSDLITSKGSRFGLTDPSVASHYFGNAGALPSSPKGGCNCSGPAAAASAPPIARQAAAPRISPQQANALSALIRSHLQATTAPGMPESTPPTPFLQTDFFLTKLEMLLRPWEPVRQQKTQPLPQVADLAKNRRTAQQYFGKPVNQVVAEDVARRSVDGLAKAVGISRAEAAVLRLAALGVPLVPRRAAPAAGGRPAPFRKAAAKRAKRKGAAGRKR